MGIAGTFSGRSLVLVAGGAVLAIWVLFPIALLPALYLNTYLHELAHALATLLTGGEVVRIEVHSNAGGLTKSIGGMPLVIASAGYIGSTLFGAVALLLSRSERGARAVAVGVSVLLILGLLLWLRGDAVGVSSAVAWAALLLLAAAKLRGAALRLLAGALGAMLCLAAVQSLVTLWSLSVGSDSHSDARLLAQATGWPDWFWAGTWALISLIVLFWCVRILWKSPVGEEMRPL